MVDKPVKVKIKIDAREGKRELANLGKSVSGAGGAIEKTLGRIGIGALGAAGTAVAAGIGDIARGGAVAGGGFLRDLSAQIPGRFGEAVEDAREDLARNSARRSSFDQFSQQFGLAFDRGSRESRARIVALGEFKAGIEADRARGAKDLRDEFRGKATTQTMKDLIEIGKIIAAKLGQIKILR